MTESKEKKLASKYSSKGSISNYTDMVITENETGLTFAQQIKVQNIISKGKFRSFLVDIVHEVTGNLKLDESSIETKKIKTYAAKIKRQSFAHSFTNEHLDFIDKNYKKMRPIEIAKILFPKIDIKKIPFSKEGKAINRYVPAIKLRNIKGSLKGNLLTEALDDPTEFSVVMDFVPPSTMKDLVALINNCDHAAEYIIDKLTKEQRKNVTALKSYLRSPRFMITVDSAPNNLYRKVLVSEYVKAIYTKNDLTADELNAYVTLCDLYGLELEAKKHIKLLNEQIEITIDDDDPKLKLSIVEALTSKTKELKDIHDQQDKLRKGLSGDRHKRLEKQVELGESLILFVNRWKEEENRLQGLKIAEARNLELMEEKNKVIKTFDDYIVEVHGVYDDEIINI